VSATGSRLGLDDPRSCPGFVTDLVVRCGRGDDGALAILFELFHPLVSSIAVVEAPQKDVTDVVLAAFQRVWRRAAAYDPAAGSAVDWVFRQMATAVAEHAISSPRRSAPALVGY
jgi:hypothetical protein